MRRTLFVTLAGIGLTGAWTQSESVLALQQGSRLWVEGTSTTKSWKCAAPATAADIAGTGAAAAVLAGGERAVRSATIRVEASRIDCGNGTMTGHARKALKTEQHPTISFVLAGYDLARSAEGAEGRLDGVLTLGGIAKPVAIAVMAKDAGAGMVRIVGRHPLRMTDHGLKPPSLMMGAMKVGDVVTVHFDFLLKAASSAPAIP